jgi:hypothetical protein
MDVVDKFSSSVIGPHRDSTTIASLCKYMLCNHNKPRFKIVTDVVHAFTIYGERLKECHHKIERMFLYQLQE